MRTAYASRLIELPALSAVVAVLKPITWFPPMWAFGCGLISVSGASNSTFSLTVALVGVILCGPLVCAASQAVNDWFDRHVDAINQPERPIPSGKLPGRWGLAVAILWTALSMVVAAWLGPIGVQATAVGLLLAWLYSAPPVRLKRSGWWGPAAVALCYEGLPWVTAAALLTNALPNTQILLIALLYSIGAHGIMTINDFKAIEGDRRFGIRSLPVTLGPVRAAQIACLFMFAAQLAVITMLVLWDAAPYAALVAALLIAQAALAVRWLDTVIERATWFSASGVSLYVIGMLVSAFALRSIGAT